MDDTVEKILDLLRSERMTFNKAKFILETAIRELGTERLAPKEEKGTER